MEKNSEEIGKHIEHLEQRLEEMEMINELGEEYFKEPTSKFVELPENLTATQYREWRKGLMK